MEIPTARRLQFQQRPNGRTAMRQTWRDLLFLHWEWDPEDLAQGMPDGLSIDLHQGRAYLGVIPFFMDRVQPRGLPALPWVSWFLELNVRTYVVDDKGVPGVWFFSLSCNQPLAVEIARVCFKLNYVHARMRTAVIGKDLLEYRCQRKGDAEEAVFRYQTGGVTAPTSPGSLEFFLVERYVLFTYDLHRNRLRSGRVHHPPYQVRAAHDTHWNEAPLRLDGFDPPQRPPDSALYSPGVDVEVFPLGD